MVLPHNVNERALYAHFMTLETDESLLQFWKDNVPGPEGKPYYTPMDYRWATMSLRTHLENTHSGSSMKLLLNPKKRRENNEKFERQWKSLIRVMVRNTDHLGDWVESRYDNLGRSYQIPSDFACPREEAPEYWEYDNTFHLIAEREADTENPLDYDILYYWQEVKPSTEPANDGRRHIILMDRKTRQEAPLLPGVKPYQD